MNLVHGQFVALTPRLEPVFEAVEASFEEPYVGITNDGRPIKGLFPLSDDGAPTAAIAVAGRAFLATLNPHERDHAVYPVDSDRWRTWTNAFPTWAPHGLLLEGLEPERRDLCMEIMRVSMSERGFADTRRGMLFNEILAGLTGDDRHDSLGEWKYRFAVFGVPSEDEPWGWQLWGHHLHVSCLLRRRQLVMTPFFLGAEPAVIDQGEYAGLTLLQRDRQAGLAFMRSLPAAGQRTATLLSSMQSRQLPPELRHPTEGRMRTGHGQDNLVLPYEGLRCNSLSPGQRGQLLGLIRCYVGRWKAGHADRKLAEVERYLADTYFAWVGGVEDCSPLYYKIHSPVIVIEYDNHAGVFLDNPEPEPFHVHTMVRTPNGNDYGFDYLRQHYADAHGGAHLRPGSGHLHKGGA